MKIYDFNGSKNIADQEKRKGSRKKCSRKTSNGRREYCA